MAVNAAHLTRTLNDKPSIFEVLAQESLQSTLKPAFQRVIEFISLSYPGKCGKLLKWVDEIFLILNTTIQYNYLTNRAASFSEHFYGLQRVSLKSQKFSNGLRLSKFDENCSLFMLAVFPYLREKMNKYAQKYSYEKIDGLTPKDWRGKFRNVFIKFHAISHFLYEFICLVQFIQFISGKSHYHSPLLKILSLSLLYAPNTTAQSESTWTEFWSNVSKGNIRAATVSFEMIGTILLRSMEIGAFFIQFLKWWEDKGPHLSMTLLPVPQMPKADVRASQYINICPICMQKWRIPTVLPVSGYVYCYKCIIRHLKDEPKCPVTGYYAHRDDLIRLYL